MKLTHRSNDNIEMAEKIILSYKHVYWNLTVLAAQMSDC